MNKMKSVSAIIMCMAMSLTLSCGSGDDETDSVKTETEGDNPSKDEATPEKKYSDEYLVKEIRVTSDSYGGFQFYTFGYDSIGNLVSYSDLSRDKGPRYAVKEKGQNYVIVSTSRGSVPRYVEEKLELNSMGLFTHTSMNGDIYYYTSEGFHQKTDWSSTQVVAYKDYTYVNEDLMLIKATVISDKGNQSYSESFEPSEELNDANIDLNLFYAEEQDYRRVLGFGGKRSKHLVASHYEDKTTAKKYWSKTTVTDVYRDKQNRISQINYTTEVFNSGKSSKSQKIMSISYKYSQK